VKVRRYVARDMRSALNQVRAEQGPDVVILSNRKVEGGVEIITAEDYDDGLLETQQGVAAEPVLPIHTQPKPMADMEPPRVPAVVAESPARVDRPSRDQPSRDQSGPKVLWTKDTLMDDMRSEIESLRTMIESDQGPADSKPNVASKIGRRLRARLQALGIAPRLSAVLLEQVPAEADDKSAWPQTMATLCKAVPTARQNLIKQGGMHTFFGPTGVGKTTVIAKLAVRYSLEYDRDSIALISTDNKRIGAFDQLRTFGEMSGLAVWTANTAQELVRAIAACQGKQLVLIDTVGLTFSRDPINNPLAIFADCLSAMKCQVVLSASGHPNTLQRIRASYRSLEPDGVIVTKLDEAASLGSVISEIVEQKVPLSYTSSGQRVPEDIDEARAHHLVSAAMALAQHEPAFGGITGDSGFGAKASQFNAQA
jgi:flagellar biosynthesis protein FlhF